MKLIAAAALLATADALFIPTPRASHKAVAAAQQLRQCSSVAALRASGKCAMVADVAVDEGNKVMWTPTEASVEQTAMRKFQKELGVDGDYDALWKWSVENSDEFWAKLMDYVGVVYEGSTSPTKEGTTMPDVQYFPNVELNFAENLLRHGAPGSPLVDAEAVVSLSESRETKRWTFGELRDDASRVRAALAKMGVTSADACGAYLSNIGETVVAMLGATSTGATWTSCSPDFGARAVADRFGQVGPKVLFTTNGFMSASKTTSIVDKVEELVDALPTLERVVVVDMVDDAPEWQSEAMKRLVVSWEDFLSEGSEEGGAAPPSEFTKVPFTHPQFVLYSSGTTGMPKSIAHGAGNTLLQHAKELVLHSDLKPEDKMLFYTTCGWMMWNWMASSIFTGAAIVCFDGFAAYPKLGSPWDVVEAEKVTHMGTSPRFFQACRARVRPMENNDLSALRVIFSTGSPLAPEDFEYVYTKVKEDLMLASISGGTDICSCFALGNPMLPVRQGELQAFGLGLDVAAMDRDSGKSVVGSKAELVCKSPFVAAPVCFFGDDEAKSKYRGAYFEDGDSGIWYHGDLVEVTGSQGACGGVVIHGRSDTTLKPGGVRIGTAEVYRFAETVDVVEDSLVIGDQIKVGKRKGDVRIVLFVKLADGVELSGEIEEAIRTAVRTGASDAHVPALIRQVKAIPYTRSGKKVELAVRAIFEGEEPKNVGALQDPTAFDEYKKMAEEGL